MNRFVLGAGLLIVLLVFVALIAFNSEYQYKGSTYEPFPEAPDFVLADQYANQFRLSDHRGKVVLLFFGYTHCPDVCPATLAEFFAIRSELDERADDVVFLFITEDPDRDTPERLRDYLGAFDAAIIGLSGDLADLQPVWADYYVAREIAPAAGVEPGAHIHGDTHDQPGAMAEDYLVLHTSRVYVIDKQGRLRLTFPYDLSFEDRMSDIKYLLNEE